MKWVNGFSISSGGMRSSNESFYGSHLGLQDLPATIDYILKNTGKPQLHYIGHSDGTTSFFAMAAMKPEMNAKIRSMHALGKVS